ncbi:hypothetical protein ACIRQF_17905 [Streptomyces sp. NPDC101191]|uniref:hypothetical protein n=1 Tax=unclassified Streptomyces TaxID=2593676 RepID=UPI0036E5E5B2
MNYSERWQEIFGPPAGGATMTLASTAPESGASGSADLQHSGGPWTSASGTAGELRTSTETSRSALGPGHEGVTTGGAGLGAVAALAGVRKSWEDRLTAVRDECEALRGNLLTVAKEMGETDTGVRNSFAGVARRPEGDR